MYLQNTLTVEDVLMKKVQIRQATAKGYIECFVGGVADLSYPNSKTRRGRVQNGGMICPTITASNIGICVIEDEKNISKTSCKKR